MGQRIVLVFQRAIALLVLSSLVGCFDGGMSAAPQPADVNPTPTPASSGSGSGLTISAVIAQMTSTVLTWTGKQIFNAGIQIGNIRAGFLAADASGNIYSDNVISAAAFKCVGDGSTDNHACLEAMWAACPTSCALQFGPGVFFDSAEHNWSFTNDTDRHLSIIGKGSQVTTLKFMKSNGFVINYSSGHANTVHFKDLALMQQTPDAGVGITVNGTWACCNPLGPTSFDNVSVFNWYIGTHINNGAYFNFNGYLYQTEGAKGVGISADCSVHCIQIQVVNSIFLGGNIGFYYGAQVEGVEIANSQFTNMKSGIYASSGGDQLAITNSQIDAYSNPIVTSAMQALFITNNLIYVHGNFSGIYSGGAVQGTISGNEIYQASAGTGYGIYANAPSGNLMTISGNQIYNFTYGIALQGTTFNVQGNIYLNNSTNVFSAPGNSVGVVTQ